MLRRRAAGQFLPTGVFKMRASVPSSLLLAQQRFAGGGQTHFDHSASFSRPLTESETQALAEQSNRTVSSVVPGKLFMRHWTAGEQATLSIVNRALSLTVTYGLILGANFWIGGVTGASWVSSSMFALTAYFLVMHTHVNLWPLFALAYLLAYFTW